MGSVRLAAAGCDQSKIGFGNPHGIDLFTIFYYFHYLLCFHFSCYYLGHLLQGFTYYYYCYNYWLAHLLQALIQCSYCCVEYTSAQINRTMFNVLKVIITLPIMLVQVPLLVV